MPRLTLLVTARELMLMETQGWDLHQYQVPHKRALPAGWKEAWENSFSCISFQIIFVCVHMLCGVRCGGGGGLAYALLWAVFPVFCVKLLPHSEGLSMARWWRRCLACPEPWVCPSSPKQARRKGRVLCWLCWLSSVCLQVVGNAFPCP